MSTLYEILGASKDAIIFEIKLACRHAASKHTLPLASTSAYWPPYHPTGNNYVKHDE